MSHYITMDYKSEVIARIKKIDAIKENLIDAEAELHEVKQMDTLSATKSAAETRMISSGKSTSHPAIVLSIKRAMLELQISEWKTIINDFNKGWNLLDEQEKEILESRFKYNVRVKDVAAKYGYTEQNIFKIQNRSLRKLENCILRF